MDPGPRVWAEPCGASCSTPMGTWRDRQITQFGSCKPRRRALICTATDGCIPKSMTSRRKEIMFINISIVSRQRAWGEGWGGEMIGGLF